MIPRTREKPYNQQTSWFGDFDWAARLWAQGNWIPIKSCGVAPFQRLELNISPSVHRVLNSIISAPEEHEIWPCACGGRSVRLEPSIGPPPGPPPESAGGGSASGAGEHKIKDKEEYQIKRTENWTGAVPSAL